MSDQCVFARAPHDSCPGLCTELSEFSPIALDDATSKLDNRRPPNTYK